MKKSCKRKITPTQTLPFPFSLFFTSYSTPKLLPYHCHRQKPFYLSTIENRKNDKQGCMSDDVLLHYSNSPPLQIFLTESFGEHPNSLIPPALRILVYRDGCILEFHRFTIEIDEMVSSFIFLPDVYAIILPFDCILFLLLWKNDHIIPFTDLSNHMVALILFGLFIRKIPNANCFISGSGIHAFHSILTIIIFPNTVIIVS